MEYHQTSSHLLAMCNGVSDKRILAMYIIQTYYTGINLNDKAALIIIFKKLPPFIMSKTWLLCVHMVMYRSIYQSWINIHCGIQHLLHEQPANKGSDCIHPVNTVVCSSSSRWQYKQFSISKMATDLKTKEWGWLGSEAVIHFWSHALIAKKSLKR